MKMKSQHKGEHYKINRILSNRMKLNDREM